MTSALKRARDERTLVSLVRRKGWEQLDGYVAAVGKEWAAVVQVADLAFAGIALVRRQDVRRVTPATTSTGTSRRALALAGHWPPAVPQHLDLWSTTDVLFTAGGLAPALGIATESLRPGTVHVGQVERIGRRNLHYREITASGRWRTRESSLPLEAITRVVVWDPYVGTLTQLAGPRG